MESIAIPQVKVSTPARRWRRILVRTLIVLVAAVLVGLMTRSLLTLVNHGQRPAGFFHGMFQGALMPAALPNLLVGNDVVIYAQDNTGVVYKLGYTMGVNTCGAFFFGIFFWRLNRWRRKRRETS